MRSRSVSHLDLRQHAVDVSRRIIQSCCGADDFELLADPAHRLTAMCLSEEAERDARRQRALHLRGILKHEEAAELQKNAVALRASWR